VLWITLHPISFARIWIRLDCPNVPMEWKVRVSVELRDGALPKRAFDRP
jgi:hypothetical protein